MQITDIYSKPRIVLKLLPGLIILLIAILEIGINYNDGFIIAIGGFIWLDVTILNLKQDLLLYKLENSEGEVEQ